MTDFDLKQDKFSNNSHYFKFVLNDNCKNAMIRAREKIKLKAAVFVPITTLLDYLKVA